jgi:GalNAc5-diNAcBac-PP-undecaprenol beta-1,3-glucosyltransferase
MATFNRAHFIEETLLSIQKQTYTNWECLIIDDGGTDNTKEVITPFLNNDNRFKYLKRLNEYQKGLPGCRNYGLDISNGDFVIFFDDDDFIHPDNLNISLYTLMKENVTFCHYQKLAYIDKLPLIENEKTSIINKITKSEIYEIITNKIRLASCTVLWKKECFINIRFNETLQYAEEWECYSRIILEGNSGVTINNILYFNRKHENSNTGEFYKNNPLRKQSYKEAILLVILSLKNKNMLNNKILKYFINMSINYKEFNLFNDILIISNQNFKQTFFWKIYFKTLPIKLYLYKIKKKAL